MMWIKALPVCITCGIVLSLGKHHDNKQDIILEHYYNYYAVQEYYIIV